MNIQNKTFSYAGFWKRFAAFVIDMFILAIGNFFIGFIFAIPDDVLTGKAEFIKSVDSYILSGLFAWVYQVVMESSVKQATLGKMALGIVVTDLSGNRMSFGKACGRYFGQILSVSICGIGFLMIGFTAKKQGLHDIMARCLVINK
ncbi:MAG: hypothetical protein A3G32_02190 [Deltaproteobacteria bacterium RIFCSPLOWO2_12_FULL_40_28]|nr:MAG: hypothetical protein A3C45_02870 [Deltaproteobacteria bacterium RIFCSPHIGHO2_02_FULL_40_28]OGQ20638.1 MAG: hypothetical protein A3E27_09980 [Deltaproteobacteria bacterium RIFCSPHIGHO2_12_FULL_40_32]OGQ38873.1 MAG: hypothetical protein A3I69_08200 [Deltaproteobacteria bacterium RIFCSPLOWO2_02_FULL_40_36]OGQ55232.1 MAG: hypothetical protein A3G32_02190 [Deltaproteobacteria bacterium RIFCSPLOWO2_12_FULL_40_28]